MNAYVLMGNTKLEIGDKLATWHDLKFNVGALMSYKDMPELEDTVPGEGFKPTIIISTKNLNRGIGGQVREMPRTPSKCFDNTSSFRLRQNKHEKDYITLDEEHDYEAKLPEASW